MYAELSVDKLYVEYGAKLESLYYVHVCILNRKWHLKQHNVEIYSQTRKTHNNNYLGIIMIIGL